MALSAVDVRVTGEVFARVKKILLSVAAEMGLTPEEIAALERRADDEFLTCPRCASARVAPRSVIHRYKVTLLISVVEERIEYHQCRQCFHEWEAK